MSLLYDAGQREIAEQTRRLLDNEITADGLLPLLERRGVFHTAFWEACKTQGWTAMALPESAGGLGLGLVELGLVAEACGRVTSGAPFLSGSFAAARALVDHGSDDLKGAWLERLAVGDAVGAIAFAEGTAALPKQPIVTFSGGGLNGVKPAVSGGLHADLAVVLASEGGRSVLVAAPLMGVARRGFESFDNSRCLADLVFKDTPATVLVSGPAVREAALHILALLAVVTAHEQTGGAQALMERARDYANTRRAFGQPIGAFQSVKHKIAELYVLTELARANAIHAASREGQADFVKAAAAARLSATEAYGTAARDCVQVHGGIGVTWEAGLHLHMRRARTLAIEGGNTLFWEDVLVDQLVGEAA